MARKTAAEIFTNACQMPLRFFSRATSRWRTLPDFCILGVPKAGTTSLYDYISRHPCIRSASRKEVLFFDRNYGRGIPYYRSYFPFDRRSADQAKPWLTGEASPYYFQHPLVAQRMSGHLQNCLFIVILRDPVERAWSHYRHNIRHGRESLSFADAIAAETERAAGDLERLKMDENYFPKHLLQHGYVNGGLYASHFERWSQHFDIGKQFLVVESRQLKTAPHQCLAEVATFLSIDEFPNMALEPKNVGITIEQDNALLDRLRETFYPENIRLQEFLGRSFSWVSHQESISR